MEYFARMDNEKKWMPLAKVKVFGGSDELVPIAVVPGTNRAFAQGTYEGREALWEMDLADQVEPKLVFSHPHVDAADPILTPDRKLLGIYYETDRPFVHYTDETTRAQVEVINRVLPNTFNYISDYSDDRQVYVVRSYGDVRVRRTICCAPATRSSTRSIRPIRAGSENDRPHAVDLPPL